jgi:serine protease Do
MGVGIDSVDQNLADAFNLDRPHGALVNDVIKGGPAESAGVTIGDVITGFNGHAIRSRDDLPYFVGLVKPGAEVKIELVRKGNPLTLTMAVGDLAKNALLSQTSSSSALEGNRLGLTVTVLDMATKTALELDAGVKVETVKGPAQQAKLQPDDIIVSVNGVELQSPADLTALEPNLPVNRAIPVLVVHEGRQSFYTIRIAE